MSFADGFRSGFGLISDVQDRQLKRDQIEADSLYKKQQSDDLKEYRKEDLSIKRAAQESKAGLDALTTEIALLNAKTASTKAATAQTVADNKTNPESIEYQKGLSEINENKATAAKLKAEGDRISGEERRYNAAVNYNSVFQYAEQADGIYDTEVLGKIEKAYQENKGTGIFNFGTAMADITLRGQQEIAGFMSDMSQGRNPEMSDTMLRAATTTLQLDASAAVGRSIDSSFVNAPEGYRNKGYQIQSQGLFNATATGADADLTGNLVVEIVNQNDPDDVQFYFPPLTGGRSYIDSKPVSINMGDFSDAYAGTAYMVQNTYKVMKPAVKSARIMAKYGNNKGSNGKAAFDSEVTAILNSNINAIKTGGNTTNLYGGDNEEFLALSRDQMISKEETEKMRARIEERLLFGAREEPMQTRAKKWLKDTYSALLAAPAAAGSPQLGQLIPEDQWSPQLISALAPYYDADETGKAFVKDPAALKRFLTSKGYMTK
jgi:hypothetical protein